MIYKAVIIEDEHKLREALFLMLQQMLADKVTVIGVAENVADAIAVIDDLQPDLIFMDVQLKDGNAFEVLEKIVLRNFHLIFTTAYQEYAIKAFKYSAIDYLLKPIDPTELQQAVLKISNRPTFHLAKEQIHLLQSNMAKLAERISLSTNDGMHIVTIADIVRCETSGSYTTFHLADGKKIMVSKSLKSYDDILQPPVFFRIHQSHTVNINFIDTYSKSGMIILKDKTILPLAQRKKEEFLRLLSSNLS